MPEPEAGEAGGARLTIRTFPDPVLGMRCAPVGRPGPEQRALAGAMLRTMYAAPGRGLAAPQVGELRRLFVMDVDWREGPARPGVYIDPEIVEAGEELAAMTEVCLSIPGIAVRLERPARIRLAWTGLDGTRRDDWLDGALARCAQHELDHLDGILTLDRLPPEERTAALSAAASRTGA